MSVIRMPPNLTFRALIYGVLTAILVLGPHPVFASPSSQTLHFPRNAKRVYPKFKKQLKKIAEHLKQNPEAILVVTGHTDDTGPERVNRKLSLTRARWIREQLVKLGVVRTASRFEVSRMTSQWPPGKARRRVRRIGGSNLRS